jgi:IS1 family transposase/transposase-like protein
MICSGCGSASHCKAGVINGRQRYKCNECRYYYTVEKKSDVKPVKTRRMALEMYLEGVGFRAIGRLLKTSYGSVYQWIKRWGKSHDLPVGNEPVKVVKLDEMHTCVCEKNCRWIWIAVDRQGKRYISFVCGDRSTATGLKLWDNIKDLKINVFTSDYWKSYEEFVPSEKYFQTKAETYTVEGYNIRIRHYLARFKHRGKCYTKAEFMIVYSLNLLFLKLNKQLYILD